MSLVCDEPSAPSVLRVSRLLARWAIWGALLLTEGLVLSELYDSTPFLGDRRWWAILLAFGPRLLGRLVIATAVTTPLIGGGPLREALRRASAHNRQRPRGSVPRAPHDHSLALLS